MAIFIDVFCVLIKCDVTEFHYSLTTKFKLSTGLHQFMGEEKAYIDRRHCFSNDTDLHLLLLNSFIKKILFIDKPTHPRSCVCWTSNSSIKTLTTRGCYSDISYKYTYIGSCGPILHAFLILTAIRHLHFQWTK